MSPTSEFFVALVDRLRELREIARRNPGAVSSAALDELEDDLEFSLFKFLEHAHPDAAELAREFSYSLLAPSADVGPSPAWRRRVNLDRACWGIDPPPPCR